MGTTMFARDNSWSSKTIKTFCMASLTSFAEVIWFMPCPTLNNSGLNSSSDSSSLSEDSSLSELTSSSSSFKLIVMLGS